MSTINTPGISRPNGLFVLADGAILACTGTTVRKLDRKDDTVEVFAGSDDDKAFRNGEKQCARFMNLQGITADSCGNITLLDRNHNSVRCVSDSYVTTLAGNGIPGHVDDVGADARFESPMALVMDADKNYVITDYGNNAVRICTKFGRVTTLAGNGDQGYQDGKGSDARFDHPVGLALDLDGSILVADCYNHAIRRVQQDGTVSTVAGNGKQGYNDGKGSDARFSMPTDVVVDHRGVIVVADAGNNCLRMIRRDGEVTTLAGNKQEGHTDGDGQNARFTNPNRLALDIDGSILVAEVGCGAQKLRRVELIFSWQGQAYNRW